MMSFPVSRTLLLNRHLRNPDHFVVQLFSYTLNENFLRKIMLSFSPIRAQKFDPVQKPVLIKLVSNLFQPRCLSKIRIEGCPSLVQTGVQRM